MESGFHGEVEDTTVVEIGEIGVEYLGEGEEREEDRSVDVLVFVVPESFRVGVHSYEGVRG